MTPGPTYNPVRYIVPLLGDGFTNAFAKSMRQPYSPSLFGVDVSQIKAATSRQIKAASIRSRLAKPRVGGFHRTEGSQFEPVSRKMNGKTDNRAAASEPEGDQ